MTLFSSDYLPDIFPQPFLGDGNNTGHVQVANAKLFTPGQLCIVSALGLVDREVLVWKIVNETIVQFAKKEFPWEPEDFTAYKLVNGACVKANFQLNPARKGVGTAKFFVSSLLSFDLNVQGTVDAPKLFSVYPLPGTRYHVTGIGIGLAGLSDRLVLVLLKLPGISFAQSLHWLMG